jgi:hypothetical protein
VEVVVPVVVLVVVAAGEAAAAGACTTNIGELSVAFVEDAETGADGSAAAGLAAGLGELVCAPDKDNVLSNAAPAKLNRFKELAIIMIGNAGSADCLKQEADHPQL